MDFELMLGRAEELLTALAANVESFLAGRPFDLEVRTAKDTGYTSVTARVRSPTPHALVFEIGEALHSFRASLDYLAFAIALRVAPEFAAAKARSIYFPICADAKDWGSKVGSLSKWATPDLVEALERVQPFHHRHAPRTEPLVVLDELNGPHKHRSLLAAGTAVIGGNFSVVDDPTGSLDMHIEGIWPGPFTSGKEVIRFRLFRPLHPTARIDFDVQFGVAFAQGGPAKGRPVVEQLEAIRQVIRFTVFPALRPFAA